MRSFDREAEFEKLGEIEELSQETAQFTIITGRRRIGKTEMIKKFYENKAHINLLVAGSVNTLMNKIFKDKKQPLFGRQTATIHARPFRPSVLKEIMSDYCPAIRNLIYWIFTLSLVE